MSKIVPFIIGGAMGVAAALLYAPRAGEQTRAMVSEKVNALWGEAKDFGTGAGSSMQDVYKQAQEKGASVFSDVAAKGQEFAATATARVKEATSQVAPAFNGESDDLKERIEAARQRIAAQVMENAEQTAAAVPAAAEAVTEAVEEAAEAVVEAVETVAEEAAE